MLRAILFDFNGVLVDDEPLHFELFRRVLAEEGLALDEEDYYRDYVGFDDASGFRFAFEKAEQAFEPQLLMRLCTRKASYYQAVVRRDGYTFFPGAIELVLAAAQEDLTLGLVSGALRSEIEPALEQAGMTTLFKTLVTADEVTSSKPDPEGYGRGLAELNTLPPLPERLFHPHEVLAIEDTSAGLRAAATAGLVTLGLAHTHSHDHLEEADLVAPSIDAIDVAWLSKQLRDRS